MKKKLVSTVLYLKSTLGVKTWVIESSFVFIILSLTALIAGKKWTEWIAVFAVLFTFCHASVANRMEEQESLKNQRGQTVSVDCYKMTTRYFYAKEILWFAYFFIIGSYSALAGVIIFLFYGWWRKVWREQTIKTV